MTFVFFFYLLRKTKKRSNTENKKGAQKGEKRVRNLSNICGYYQTLNHKERNIHKKNKSDKKIIDYIET